MASPAFSINGNTVGAVTAVAAGASVVGTIDNTAGIGATAWRVSATDDTGVPADYEPVSVSGSLSEVGTVTAGVAGTSGVLTVRINNGVNIATGNTDLDATEYSVKWYVPVAGGGQVLVAGEQERENRFSSPTHGMIAPINAQLRQLAAINGAIRGGSAGLQQTDGNTFIDVGGIVADFTGTPSTDRVIEFIALASTNNAGIATEVRLLNYTTGMVVTSSTLSTTSTTPAKLTATITPDATFSASAEQILSVQLRKSLAGTPSDLAFLLSAEMRVRYA